MLLDFVHFDTLVSVTRISRRRILVSVHAGRQPALASSNLLHRQYPGLSIRRAEYHSALQAPEISRWYPPKDTNDSALRICYDHLCGSHYHSPFQPFSPNRQSL